MLSARAITATIREIRLKSTQPQRKASINSDILQRIWNIANGTRITTQNCYILTFCSFPSFICSLYLHMPNSSTNTTIAVAIQKGNQSLVKSDPDATIQTKPDCLQPEGHEPKQFPSRRKSPSLHTSQFVVLSAKHRLHPA